MTMSVLLIRPIDEALFKINFAASGAFPISKLRIGSGSMGTVGLEFLEDKVSRALSQKCPRISSSVRMFCM